MINFLETLLWQVEIFSPYCKCVLDFLLDYFDVIIITSVNIMYKEYRIYLQCTILDNSLRRQMTSLIFIFSGTLIISITVIRFK
jgi:hypothetical protein